MLDLHHNHRRCLWQISILQPGTFNNLSKLKELYLNNNTIRELQPGIFDNLPRLVYLNLYNNIIELQPNSYYGLHINVEIII